MGGMIGIREIRNKRARTKMIKRIAGMLKDKSLIVYKRFLMKMIAQYRPMIITGTILTERTEN